MPTFIKDNVTHHWISTPKPTYNHSTAFLFSYNIPAFVTIFSILIVIAVTANLFALIVIYRSSPLHTINNFFVFNLAIVDLISGLVVLPLSIIVVIERFNIDQTLCKIQAFLVMFLYDASLLTATAVSIDRCIAVTRPYYYAAIAKMNIIKSTIVAIWLISITFAALPLLELQQYGLGYYTFVYVCWINIHDYHQNYIMIICIIVFILLSMLATVISYIIIFRIACSKAIHHVRLSGYGDVIKSARTSAIIVGTKLLLWLPFIIVFIIEIAKSSQHETGSFLNSELFKIAFLMPFATAATNPIIYITTNGILRKKFQKLFQVNKTFRIHRPIAISPSRHNNGTRAFILEQLHSITDPLNNNVDH